MDDAVRTAVSSVFRPESFLPRLIVKLLREQGITLSARDIAALRKQLLKRGAEELTISVDESRQPGLSEAQVRKRVGRALAKLRPASMRVMRQVRKSLPDIVQGAIEAGATYSSPNAADQ